MAILDNNPETDGVEIEAIANTRLLQNQEQGRKATLPTPELRWSATVP